MTARDRRALAWGAFAVSSLLALRALPAGARRVSDLRQRAAASAAALARARAVLADAPAQRNALSDALARMIAFTPQLVGAGSGAEAGANLLGLVSAAASQHALRVVRLDLLPDSSLEVFGRAAVHAEVEGDVAALTRLLRAVEVGDPLLTVARLAVLAPYPAASGRPEVLRLEARVEGWYLARGAP